MEKMTKLFTIIEKQKKEKKLNKIKNILNKTKTNKRKSKTLVSKTCSSSISSAHELSSFMLSLHIFLKMDLLPHEISIRCNPDQFYSKSNESPLRLHGDKIDLYTYDMDT